MGVHPSSVLRRCASTSSFHLPVNSGLKWDQFNCGIRTLLNGLCGWTAGYARGAGSSMGGTGGTTGGITGVTEGRVVLYQPYLFML